MKKLVTLFVMGFATLNVNADNWFSNAFNWNNTDKQYDVIVNGSLKGSTNAFAQLLVKDSQEGKFPGIKLNAVVPGNACMGFKVLSEQDKDATFVTSYENYYQLVAERKNDASCPAPDFNRGKPIVSYVQSLYLVVQAGTTVEDLKSKKLKFGYSGSGPENDWHAKMNKAFGQDHVFVGYKGSGNMRSGLAAGEVDGVWTTYSNYLRTPGQKEGKFAIIMRTLDQGRVEVPILADTFNDPTLSRAFLNGWYVFNDKDNIAAQMAEVLAKDVQANAGHVGTYINTKKLATEFNQGKQMDLEKSLSWDQ